MYGSSTMKDHYSKFRSKVTTNHHVKNLYQTTCI